jgi:hypothetical protein
MIYHLQKCKHIRTPHFSIEKQSSSRHCNYYIFTLTCIRLTDFPKIYELANLFGCHQTIKYQKDNVIFRAEDSLG